MKTKRKGALKYDDRSSPIHDDLESMSKYPSQASDIVELDQIHACVRGDFVYPPTQAYNDRKQQSTNKSPRVHCSFDFRDLEKYAIVSAVLVLGDYRMVSVRKLPNITTGIEASLFSIIEAMALCENEGVSAAEILYCNTFVYYKLQQGLDQPYKGEHASIEEPLRQFVKQQLQSSSFNVTLIRYRDNLAKPYIEAEFPELQPERRVHEPEKIHVYTNNLINPEAFDHSTRPINSVYCDASFSSSTHHSSIATVYIGGKQSHHYEVRVESFPDMETITQGELLAATMGAKVIRDKGVYGISLYTDNISVVENTGGRDYTGKYHHLHNLTLQRLHSVESKSNAYLFHISREENIAHPFTQQFNRKINANFPS
ncbi:hypothetical protein DH09_14015 [Bacillaceae bacterium JMAK1]|nr:hypothetical protein DH09_14015 [Bacillaceae bacterium JMAK1]